MLDPISHQHSHSLLLNKSKFLGNGNRSAKTFLLLVSAIAMLVPGLAARAEIIQGKIESYSASDRQAIIDLGLEDGIGKHDRGKIKLTSLDSPNVEFIGANIVVISVEENSAVVSVKEAPGVQIPIQSGAAVTVDTESGIAQREEEAKIVAAQQAEEARRARELEEARTEKARREREQEEARAAEIRRQREQEEARIQETRRQQQIETQRAEAARRQRELEEERREVLSEGVATGQIEPDIEANRTTDLDEAKNLWQSNPNSDTNSADLPSDYLQAYTDAREQPSAETYYRFAEVLIDYEITDRALTWLDETESRFPETKSVNNLYRAVALVQQGKVKQGENTLNVSELPEDPLIDEFKSYLYTQKGEWNQVFAQFEAEESAVTYNNRLIALYCTEPFIFDRDTDLNPGDCPFGSVARLSSKDLDEMDDDEFEAAIAASDRSKETLAKISEQAFAQYPEDPYILNTLGFIALQLEDYQYAYDRYEELVIILDRYDSTPPRFQSIKANAVEYANNYNQNYEFLAQNDADLDSRRSDQDSLGNAIIIGGAGSLITSAVTSDISPVGIIGGIISTFLRFNNSKSRGKDIEQERNSILDQMHETFTKDVDLVAALPSLKADSLLSLDFSQTKPASNPAPTDLPAPQPASSDSPEMQRKMREFDQFWENN